MRNAEPLHPAQLFALEKLSGLKVGALYVERQEGKLRLICHLLARRLGSGRVDRVLWLCTRRKKERILRGLECYLSKYAERVEVCGLETLSHNLNQFLMQLETCETARTMLVIDNGLLIKNPDALRTRRVIELSSRCAYRLLVSDVPLVSRASDMFSQWYALDWRILGYQTYWGFCLNHVRGSQSCHMEYLSRAIAPYSVQILRSEVQPIAGRREYIWQFQLPPALKAHYQEVSERFLWRAFGSNMGVYRMLLACRQVACGRRVVQDYPLKTEPFDEESGHDARLQALMEVLRHFEGRRALILCYYRFEQEAIVSALRGRHGEDSVRVYAPSACAPCPFTVMNLQADGWESARLDAEVIVHYSSDWNWKKRHEKEKECQNALPGGELTVVSLVAADTIDMQIMRCLWSKDKLIAMMRRELDARRPAPSKE